MSLYVVPRRSDEKTVEVLEAALRRAMHGRVAGVSMTLMAPGGEELHIRTGTYRDRPAEAVRAALNVSIMLTKIEEEWRGPP